jgi:formate/nitrite transporter
MFGSDAYSPKEIAERVENVGVAKARLPLLSQLVLGILAGVFIGFGAMFFTLVTSDSSLSFALSRVLGGAVFSLGLILVVIAGAELFTGNNLLVMAWTSGRISLEELLRNWTIIWAANFAGAAGLALVVALSNHTAMNDGLVGAQAMKIAAAKTALPFAELFFKGFLCNTLVCLAVWLAMAGRTVVDKIVAIVMPITAFVAAGFEHSIANMYFITLGLILKAAGVAPAGVNASQLDIAGLVHNLVPVTLGNILGGVVMVALCYHVVYRRGVQQARPAGQRAHAPTMQPEPVPIRSWES